MKIQTAILALAFISIYACTPTRPNNQNAQAIDRMERFVDSLETEVTSTTQHAWADIEQEYARLSAHAKRALSSSASEGSAKYERLDERYEQWKADVQNDSEQLSSEADQHLQNVENWFDRTSDNVRQGVENVGYATKEQFEESKNWIERNYEKLEDASKERYDRLKERMNNKS